MDKIVLLKGGTSEEREVSLHTCFAIEGAFKRLGNKFEIIDPYNFLENGKVNYTAFARKIYEIAPEIVLTDCMAELEKMALYRGFWKITASLSPDRKKKHVPLLWIKFKVNF